MNPYSMTRTSLLALATIAGLVGCGQDDSGLSRLAATGPDLRSSVETDRSSSLVTIPFDPANFVRRVTNPYFPLTPGRTYTYKGVSRDGEQRNTVEVTHDTKVILGVTTIVVHDRVYIEDGSLLEDTFDWYAQDRQGNVWYFGEDTKEYDHGVLVTTAGSWEAGKGNAKPGIIMLANPRVGDTYKQEDAPGVVEDMGKVVRLGETVTVPTGTYTNCLMTTEWTPIEPGNRSNKFYAPGVGNVLEVASRQGGERVELISVK